jgi:phosphatidate phosphatase APP1
MAESGGNRWSAALLKLAHVVEPHFDEAKYRLRDRAHGDRKVVVVPYRGYGTRQRLWLKGRVLLEPQIGEGAKGDASWRNLVAAWKRFESDEVPGARVRVSAAGAVTEVETDDEGYFEVWLDLATEVPATAHTVPVRCEALTPRRRGGEPAMAEGEALLPPASARLAVVSDIDDTVVPTGAGKLLRMARNVLLHNAHTRAPFPGVAALYRALAAGKGAEGNPFVYVSSGPWNLYDLLLGAFRLHELPAGPFHLRDWGLGAGQALPTRHHDHKLSAIRQAMELWEGLPFLLIGDSGQHDPEIYRQVTLENPGRVLAVYIRNVSEGEMRPSAIRELAREVEGAGSSLLLAPTAWELAQDAHARGWLGADALPAVAAGVGKDGVRSTTAAGPAAGTAPAGSAPNAGG